MVGSQDLHDLSAQLHSHGTNQIKLSITLLVSSVVSEETCCLTYSQTGSTFVSYTDLEGKVSLASIEPA